AEPAGREGRRRGRGDTGGCGDRVGDRGRARCYGPRNAAVASAALRAADAPVGGESEMRAWHAQLAWLPPALGGVRERVLIETHDERVAGVPPGVDPPAGAGRLQGLVIPGLANAHSHAFQRALRGRTEAAESGGSFWTWREQMYRLAWQI